MKKVLALLLACVLVVSMVACSNGSSDDKEDTKAPASGATEDNAGGDDESEAAGQDSVVGVDDPENADLTFVWWGNQIRTDYTTAACELYKSQHPGVTIEYMPVLWDDYWTKLATDAAGNNLPDLLQQDYAYLAQFVENGDQLDLNPWIEAGKLDVSNISEATMATGQIEGGTYALCAGINAPSMLYNKTLTDSLGIEVPDNMTWAQFAEISKEIYEKSGVKTMYGYGNSENPQTYFIRSKGYKALFEDDKLSYDDPTIMEEYYQRLIDGLEEGWLMDSAILAGLDTTSVEMNPLVYYSAPEYQSWESCCFSNQVAAYQAAAKEGVEYALTTWPSDDPTASNYIKPSQFFSITTDTSNADASVQVLDALINDIDINKELKAERGIPASSVVAEALLPDMDEVNQMIVTYVNEVATPNSSPIFDSLPAASTEVVNSPIKEIAEKVLYGEMTAEEAAAEFFTRANEILAAGVTE